MRGGRTANWRIWAQGGTESGLCPRVRQVPRYFLESQNGQSFVQPERF